MPSQTSAYVVFWKYESKMTLSINIYVVLTMMAIRMFSMRMETKIW